MEIEEADYDVSDREFYIVILIENLINMILVIIGLYRNIFKDFIFRYSFIVSFIVFIINEESNKKLRLGFY